MQTAVPDDGESTTDEPVVLVVDDETAVLEAYEACLADEYDVRTAASGEAALVALDPAVDVVLLDRRMPGLSGDDVLEHIDQWHTDCRVAMVTAVDPAATALDLPFDDYLTKPVGRDDLRATVDRLLLLDEYERLLARYTDLANKCATLKAIDTTDLDVDELEARCETLREQIATMAAALDDEIAAVIDE